MGCAIVWLLFSELSSWSKVEIALIIKKEEKEEVVGALAPISGGTHQQTPVQHEGILPSLHQPRCKSLVSQSCFCKDVSQKLGHKFTSLQKPFFGGWGERSVLSSLLTEFITIQLLEVISMWMHPSTSSEWTPLFNQSLPQEHRWSQTLCRLFSLKWDNRVFFPPSLSQWTRSVWRNTSACLQGADNLPKRPSIRPPGFLILKLTLGFICQNHGSERLESGACATFMINCSKGCLMSSQITQNNQVMVFWSGGGVPKIRPQALSKAYPLFYLFISHLNYFYK